MGPSQSEQQMKAPLFFLLLLPTILVHIYHMILASRVRAGLGDDAFISHSMGKYIVDNYSGLINFLKSLISGFVFEDHLMPITFINGIFLYLFSDDPAFIFSLSSKLVVLTSTLLSIWLAWEILRCRLKVLAFAILLIFNISIHWRSMILNFQSQWTVPWGILAALYLNRYWQLPSKKNLTLMLMFASLAFYTFETALIIFAYMAFFCLINSWTETSSTNFLTKLKKLGSLSNPSTKKTLCVGISLLICILPYLLIHQYLFDFPIPSARNQGAFSFAYLISSFALSFTSSFYFDLYLQYFAFSDYVRYGTPLAVTLLFLLFGQKLKILSLSSWKLFFNFVFLTLLIALTKRYDPGLWPFAGIIICMALAEPFAKICLIASHLITKVLKNSQLSTATVFFVVIALASYKQTKVLAFKYEHSMRPAYDRVHDQTAAFALSLPSGKDSFKIFRLEDSALDTDNYFVLWMTSKQIYKDYALSFYPDELLFHLPPHTKIELYDFEMPFLTMVDEINRMLVKNENVTLKDKTAYSSLFLAHPDNLILHSRPYTLAEDGIYDIYLPQIKWIKNNSNLSMRIKFANPIQESIAQIRLSLNQAEIRNILKINENEIGIRLTKTPAMPVHSKLKLGSLKNLKIESIQVQYSENFPLKIANGTQRESHLILSSSSYPCYFAIKSDKRNLQIHGLVTPDQSVKINFDLALRSNAKEIKIIYKALKIPRPLNSSSTTSPPIPLSDFQSGSVHRSICSPDQI